MAPPMRSFRAGGVNGGERLWKGVSSESGPETVQARSRAGRLTCREAFFSGFSLQFRDIRADGKLSFLLLPSGGKCFSADQPVLSIRGMDVFPMERMIRDVGKNPFHVLLRDFGQDDLAVLLFSFKLYGFPGGSVKDVPRACSGVVNPDGCSVGRIRPRFRLPGLAGRADKDVLNGRAFQNPGENPFPRNMAFLFRTMAVNPFHVPGSHQRTEPVVFFRNGGVFALARLCFFKFFHVWECILPSRGEETETGTLISRAIPGKGVYPYRRRRRLMIEPEVRNLGTNLGP